MTAILTALFVALLLPILAKAPLVIAMSKQPGGYDNRHPRAQQQNLKGFGARANAAHYNSFEALLFFAPAVLASVALGQVDTLTVTLAWVFVVSRVVYLVMYWANLSSLRSLVWLVGILCSFIMLGRVAWGG